MNAIVFVTVPCTSAECRGLEPLPAGKACYSCNGSGLISVEVTYTKHRRFVGLLRLAADEGAAGLERKP